jgi:histidinol-phosphate aminotransferase
MNWLTELARPEIRALRAYEHAVWEPGLVRLHANESPWRSPGDDSAAGLNRYPEPHPHELCAALSRLYGVAEPMLLAARGSDEAIDLLIRAYCRAGLDAVLICPPTFGMYAVAARIQGAAVLEVPLLRERGFALASETIARACRDGAAAGNVKLVFVCSPNNPTGNRMPAAQLLELARELEGRALLVIDEAYVEFAEAASLAGEVERVPGLVVLRTLSKAHGLAGARCGALIAHPEVIALLRRVIQPYALAQLTIEAVFKALEPAALAAARERNALLRAERRRMSAALAALAQVRTVWPSEANFLLLECADAGLVLARAHAAGILVRDLRAASGLTQALRISIGTPEQNERLLAALR